MFHLLTSSKMLMWRKATSSQAGACSAPQAPQAPQASCKISNHPVPALCNSLLPQVLQLGSWAVTCMGRCVPAWPHSSTRSWRRQGGCQVRACVMLQRHRPILVSEQACAVQRVMCSCHATVCAIMLHVQPPPHLRLQGNCMWPSSRAKQDTTPMSSHCYTKPHRGTWVVQIRG
jgi:hypothetical protein